MKKSLRIQVHQKYGGRCAYCGQEIELSAMQVDHVIPKNRWSEKHQCLIVDGRKFTEYGIDDLRNLNPACRVCNNWKLTHTLEDFRSEIAAQIKRLRDYSANFRMAERYELIQTTDKQVVFYFER